MQCASFQQRMETVLAGLARDSCMVYLNDIVVIGVVQCTPTELVTGARLSAECWTPTEA